MKEKEWSRIRGTVSAVIFKNEENGYTVLHFITEEGDEIVLTGILPEAAPGEEMEVLGEWVSHPAYGDQFSVVSFDRRLPADEKGILEYLSSGVIKGVGPAIARRIVEHFGRETFSVMESEPERLQEIRGISSASARIIGESFRAKASMRLLAELMLKNGIEPQLAARLYAVYGADALEMIQENPYLICEEQWNGDFAAADRLAQTQGFSPDDERRLAEGLVYELSYNIQNGHTFIPADKLLPAAAHLLGVSEEQLEGPLEVLEQNGRVVIETVGERRAVYLSDLFADEVTVAEAIEAYLASREQPILSKKALEKLLGEQDFFLAERQKEAVCLAAREKILLLTGGPGTGKTTTIRSILALFDACGLNTVLAAPTGRAAKRMGSLCGREAKTIHRILEASGGRLGEPPRFARCEANPIDADAVVVDECSMVDLRLAAALFRALPSDARIVLVGDPDQLPPVGPGSFLSDLLRAERVPTVRLNQVFRQAAESGIVRSAHRINKGQMPEISGMEDFYFIRRGDPRDIGRTMIELIEQRIPGKFGIERQSIQVLSPWRQREAGTLALNRMLADRLNPPEEGKNELRVGNQLFREGDRVMQIRNNYDLTYEKDRGMETGTGVFNGDIGEILCIDDEEEVMLVMFDDRMVRYPFADAGELELAYAVTVHKAQGSEFEAVLLSAADGPARLLNRSMLYTAVTRAKKLMIIVGSERSLTAMVENQSKIRRYSGLYRRLAAGPHFSGSTDGLKGGGEKG